MSLKSSPKTAAPHPVKISERRPPSLAAAKDSAIQGVPENFRLTEYHLEFNESKAGAEANWIQIADRLEVVAATRNERREDWGRMLRFYDQDGQEKTLAVPMDRFAGDASEVRAMLLNRGLRIFPDRRSRDLVNMYIQVCRPQRTVQCVNRIGWTVSDSGIHCFVFPDGTIGCNDVILQSQEILEHPYRTSGTLAEWQDHIAKPAAGNSRLSFAICAAFAAPMLPLLHVEGGGFHFTGTSSLGKTTLLRAAGSVFGGGSHGYIRPWRATDNGIEAIAALHNHALLCLDEIGQVDGRHIGNIAYMLANGSGKSRADRNGGGRRSAKWCTLFISTGEQSLSDKIAEDTGGGSKAGQEIRVLDIPADAGAGFGCYEDLHSFSGGAELSEHLNEASQKYYGTAIRTLIQHLADNASFESRQALKDTFGKARNRLLLGLNDTNGQIDRAITRFAVAATAGETAIRIGILPWEKGEAFEAARICFAAWLSNRGGTRLAEEIAVVHQVQHHLQAYGESRFIDMDSLSPYRPQQRLGYRKVEDDGVHYLALPRMMEQEICKGLARLQAVRILAKLGFLKTSEKKRFTMKERLPDQKVAQRVYHILPAIMSFDSEIGTTTASGTAGTLGTDGGNSDDLKG